MNTSTYAERVQDMGPLEAPSSGPTVRRGLQKYIGGAIFIGVVVGTLLLWILLRPADQLDRRYIGGILGVLAATRKHPGFRAHLEYSSSQGKLSVESIARTCSGTIGEKDIYMCGPTALTTSFQRALRKRGLSAHQIHFEDFNFC